MLYTYTLTSQSVNAGAPVTFNTNGITEWCAIQHSAGSTTTTITRPGLYIITFNCDATLATTGDAIFTAYNKGTAIDGAVTQATVASGDTDTFSFTAAIRVLPSCPYVINTAEITIVNSSTSAATLSNAALTIRRAQ